MATTPRNDDSDATTMPGDNEGDTRTETDEPVLEDGETGPTGTTARDSQPSSVEADPSAGDRLSAADADELAAQFRPSWESAPAPPAERKPEVRPLTGDAKSTWAFRGDGEVPPSTPPPAPNAVRGSTSSLPPRPTPQFQAQPRRRSSRRPVQATTGRTVVNRRESSVRSPTRRSRPPRRRRSPWLWVLATAVVSVAAVVLVTMRGSSNRHPPLDARATESSGTGIDDAPEESATTESPAAQVGETAQLFVRTVPATAQLFIDEKAVPNPYDRLLDRGASPILKATAKGYEDAVLEVALDRDRWVTLRLRPIVEPRPTPGTPSPAAETAKAKKKAAAPRPRIRRTKRVRTKKRKRSGGFVTDNPY